MTDVSIPDADRIGDVDQGWTVGTRWMYHERRLYNSPYTSIPVVSGFGASDSSSPVAVARDAGRLEDPVARDLIGESRMLLLARQALGPRSRRTVRTVTTTSFFCQGEGREFESRHPLHEHAGQRPNRGADGVFRALGFAHHAHHLPINSRPCCADARFMQGSVRQRSIGSFELRVFTGVDPHTGKRCYRSQTVRGNRAEAERELAAMLDAVRRGPGVAARTTVGELLERWFAIAETIWAPTTIRQTRSVLDRYLHPHLGARPVADLTTADIDDLCVRLRNSGGIGGKPLQPGTHLWYTIRVRLVYGQDADQYRNRGDLHRGDHGSVRGSHED